MGKTINLEILIVALKFDAKFEQSETLKKVKNLTFSVGNHRLSFDHIFVRTIITTQSTFPALYYHCVKGLSTRSHSQVETVDFQ